MKRIILLTVIQMMIANVMVSQNLKYGLVGEIGHSWSKHVGLTDNLHSGYNITYSVGVWINKTLSPKSSIEINATWFRHTDNVEQESIIYEPNGEISSGSTSSKEIKSYFISLPLLYCYQLGQRVKLAIGPQASYYVTGNRFYSYNTFVGGYTISDGVKGSFVQKSFWDLGTKLNLEYVFMDNTRVYLSYYHGLKDVSDVEVRTKRTNRALTIGLKHLVMADE